MGNHRQHAVAFVLGAMVALVVMACPCVSGSAPCASSSSSGRGRSAEGVAWVSQDPGACVSPAGACVTFLAALTDGSVTLVNLVTDVQLDPGDFEAYEGHLYPLCRNLTITSAPTAPGGRFEIRSLDTSFMSPRVLIGSGLTVTFADIRLKFTRKMSGTLVDFFMGSPNSTLAMVNVPFYRYAGLPVDVSLPLLISYTRPDSHPGKQRVRALNGGCTPEAQRDLVYEDLAMEAGSVVATASPNSEMAMRSYTLVLKNVTRECLMVIPETCMRAFTPDTCLEMITDEHLKQQRHQAPVALSVGQVAGIAAGATVGALLLLGPVALIVLRRGRQREGGSGRGRREADCSGDDGKVLESPASSSV